MDERPAISDENEGSQDPPVPDQESPFHWFQRVTTPSPSIRRWPTTATSRGVRGGLATCARAFFRAATITNGNAAEAWACELLDRSHWPTRPLRVGVSDATLRQSLERTAGCCAVEWVATPATRTAQELFRRYTLDAFLRMDARGGVILSTPEAPRHAAAWHDWSTERPVTFATLFPGRVDCAELTLPSDASRPGATWFLRSLIEAAATLSRHPSRLTSEDRLRGRTPRIDTLRAVDLPPTNDPVRDAQRLVIHALYESMREAMQMSCRPGCIQAARLVSAFVAGSDDELPEALRLDMAEACASLAPNEAEVQLRLAAVRLASYVDAPALDAILTGERLLRDNQLNGGTTQLPFLQAELELGRGTPVSLGRVAAGVAMVCASLETSRIPYFRDDLLDDARFSGWLIPKDQDRGVLIEVFRAILLEREGTQTRRLVA
jgi:hypothetical protein